MAAQYEFLRALYARCKTRREAERLTEAILYGVDGKPAIIDQKGADGRYLLDPKDFDAKGIREALQGADYSRRTEGLTEAIGSQEFPQITGGFIAKKLLRSLDEYGDQADFVGDQLFSKDDSTLKGDKIARVDALSLLKPTPWGMEPAGQELGESYVTCNWARFAGYVEVTEDLIIHDQTSQVWGKVSALSRMAMETLERVRLDTVQDRTTSHSATYPGNEAVGYYAYRPSGTATALYATSGSPTGSANDGNQFTNALADWTDLDNARQRIAQFLDDSPARLTNTSTNAGKRIRILRGAMPLIPITLQGTMSQIMFGQFANTDANNKYNPAGTMPGANFLHSPYYVSQILDEASTSTWYYGMFKEQFHERMAIPMRVLTADRASQAEFQAKGIYARVMVEFYGAWYASDNRLVVKCTG